LPGHQHHEQISSFVKIRGPDPPLQLICRSIY